MGRIKKAKNAEYSKDCRHLEQRARRLPACGFFSFLAPEYVATPKKNVAQV